MAVQTTAQELLERVRAGDRQAAADLFTRFGPLIRQRCRSRMSQALRAVTDSEDVWSTVTRRFDEMMVRGGLDVDGEASFWKLVTTLTEHAIVDRSRVLARLERAKDEDEPFAQRLRDRMLVSSSSSGDVMERILDAVRNPVDRDILRLWLTERSHAEIGRAVNLSEGAVRVRWHGLRQTLRQILEERAV